MLSRANSLLRPCSPFPACFTLARRSAFSDNLMRYKETLEANCGIWGAGSNEFGQLSTDQTRHIIPAQVNYLPPQSNFTKIATNHTHAIALTSKGKIWIWGTSRWSGVTLQGTGNRREKPISPEGLRQEHIVDIAAGREHNLFLADNVRGERVVYSCGSHEFGQCGIGGNHGEGAGVSIPHTIGTFTALSSRVCQVAAGFEHSLALTEDGRVFSWGNGVEGQLGHGNGEWQIMPKHVEGLSDIQSIYAGTDCSAAITLNGELYVWGANEYNQLGVGSKNAVEATPMLVKALEGVRVKKVAVGGIHMLALDREKSVYGWGSNQNGQLGLNQQVEYEYPEPISSLANKDVVDISTNDSHTVCVTELGSAYSFGAGACGELGLGNKDKELLPSRIDSFRGYTVTSAVCGINHTLFLVEH